MVQNAFLSMIRGVQFETVVENFAHLFGFQFLAPISLLIKTGVAICVYSGCLRWNVLRFNKLPIPRR